MQLVWKCHFFIKFVQRIYISCLPICVLFTDYDLSTLATFDLSSFITAPAYEMRQMYSCYGRGS